LHVTRGVTGVTGSGALSAAERQRAKRARDKAARELERREAEAAPLRLVMAHEAEQQIAAIDAALGDDQRGLAPAERLIEGARALILRLYGNPLLRMAERAALPVDVLARRLNCPPVEAAKLQQADDRELLDRIFGKAVQAVRADGAPPIAVSIIATPGIAATLNLVADQGLGREDAT
jgi:hypothetical protein